ncbi:rhodanese-like domain-containing protein [Marispirochaeta sp.]|jgi:rhodanese-related sulfurtransferase|uniref:rhodanese-like domain-containing protein n=1 Tax=Marispirochaeta sp. TaxID=2038653 RepID=UPI0029C5FBBF|nr:rhodanese-like domain-containing protein [Marispirochaeta sp.]
MMKKTAAILITLVLALSIVSCGKSGNAVGLAGNEEITMQNIDQYIDADARFIDLRNFADMFNGGYIAGFEVVPFFQYLEGRALVRNNGWEFSEADIVEKAMLENIFGSTEDAIVLMCGSGTRAGYVKDALESIGYTKVINAGGIRDYKGENKILGDGSYSGQMALPSEVTMENIDQYLYRDGAKYVDLRNVSDMYTGGYIDSFELVSFFEYLEGNALVRNNGWEFSEADVAEKVILENIFGDKDREVFLMCGSGTRAGYVKDALESIGYTSVFNVGGIRDYKGDHKVFGDESFSLSLK